MNHSIEIRSLNLKPGSREEFRRLYIEKGLPLLKRWNFDVVAHGPSLHDENTYYVIRRYDSLAEREQMEDAYYASDDWRKGPREAMLALIETYIDVVFEVDEITVEGFRGHASARQVGNLPYSPNNPSSMTHYVEFRSYTLKPGTRYKFHRLFFERAFPMLQRWQVDVVAYGPSLHDSDSYFLMRRYNSLAQREESENAFYSSDEWRQGPRESILALIENYTEIVLEVDGIVLQGLRAVKPHSET
jgi:hypothetical protein